MDTHKNTAILEARISELINDQLIQAFWDAYKHFKTTDLVVYFDENTDHDPLSIFTRESIIKSKEISEKLLFKLSKPAKEATFIMSASETAFWFIATFRDSKMACVAVNAKQISQGGNA